MSNSIASECCFIVRFASEPWEPGDSIKAKINRAAARLNIGVRRATAFWYQEDITITAEEIDALRLAQIRLTDNKIERLEAELLKLRELQNVYKKMEGHFNRVAG